MRTCDQAGLAPPGSNPAAPRRFPDRGGRRRFPAVAGPPCATEDPEPTDLGHWEIYLFGAAGGAHGAWDGAAGADLDHGAFENVQLTATLPLDHAALGLGIGGIVKLGCPFSLLASGRADPRAPGLRWLARLCGARPWLLRREAP